MFVAFWIIGHDFLSGYVLTGRNLRKNFLFHGANPRLGFQSEQHRKVSLGRVPDTIVEQATHDDVGIELHIRPVVEGKFPDPVEQFLLFLEQDVLVKGRETVPVLLERLVQNHVLYPTVFDNFLLAAREAMLIDFQNVFRIVGLDKETN